MTISTVPPASTTASADVLAARRARLDERVATLRALTARWNRLGNIRLLVFALFAVCAVGWVFSQRAWLGFAALPLLALFVALVVRHRRVGAARAEAAILAGVAEEAVWRLERNWDALPLRHEVAVDPSHPYAADLDLFGRASLMHLLDVTVTPAGRATLADWLLALAGPAEIAERQAAVRELAGRADLRDALAVAPRLAGGASADPSAFLAWAEETPYLAGRPLLGIVIRATPLLTVALVIAQLAGLIPAPLWILPVIANLLIAQANAGEALPRIRAATSQYGAMRGYAALLELLEEADLASPRLQALRAEARTAGQSAARNLRWLAGIARWQMPAGSMLHLPAQGLLLWDLNHLAWLERWQRAAGRSARGWLRVAGEVEALGALASLAADHPTWVFPAVDPLDDMIDAVQIGHPLLPDDQRVANDVRVGPPGTFLLVTGSNMSGKSTLLRSIGINIVLAQAGGPVCAEGMRLPPVALWTSVRVQDSLAQGVSFFMAELLRLKQIVDAANAAGPGDPRVCFILDEMLQGTNTAERQIAARRIVRRLVDRGAIGAVSTHDLTLAEGPELAPIADAVHFTEQVRDTPDGPSMTFDYRLRPGIATSTNALRLMDVVGFDFAAPPVGERAAAATRHPRSEEERA